MSETAQVFVGTDPRMAKAEAVLEHSLRTHASIDVEIHWMRAGDPGFDGWTLGRAPGRPYSGTGWATDFSGFRFAVPALAGFRGRAIYLDADMLVLGDVAELWRRHQRRPWTCPGGRSEVSVIDCAAFRTVRWWPSLPQLERTADPFGACWQPLVEHGWVDRSLGSEWNRLDRWTPDAKLVHFTDMHTQPWRPWPDALRYRPHPDPAAEALFWRWYHAATGTAQDAQTTPTGPAPA